MLKIAEEVKEDEDVDSETGPKISGCRRGLPKGKHLLSKVEPKIMDVRATWGQVVRNT